MTRADIPLPGTGPTERTWSHVTRLIRDHPEVRQVRLQPDVHGVSVGFYEAPTSQTLEKIKASVQQELSGQWDISLEPEGASPILHLHRIDAHTTEVHRAHPPNEPPVIWKPIRLPAWGNRTVPPPVERNPRVMLLLAGVCGLATLAGFLMERGGAPTVPIVLCFAIAYFTGGWFAVQDVAHSLKD